MEKSIFKKFSVMFLLSFMFISFNLIPVYAFEIDLSNDMYLSELDFEIDIHTTINDEGITSFYYVQQDDTIIPFIEIEDGVFAVDIPMVALLDDRAVGTAVVRVFFYRDFHINNLFEVAYSLSSNSLVSGLRTTFTITDTSVFFPQTYGTIPVNHIFNATTLYHSPTIGTILVNPGTSSVRVRTNNSSIHFMNGGWLTIVSEMNEVRPLNSDFDFDFDDLILALDS